MMTSGIVFTLTLADVLFCFGSVFLTLLLVALVLWLRSKYEVKER